MRLYIDQITVYKSLFINKANVNRGSRNGMTCINVTFRFQLNWKYKLYVWLGSLAYFIYVSFEARLEKTYHQGFQPGQTLPYTSILSVIEVRLNFESS